MIRGPFNDGHMFAQDLSFMSEDDWKRLSEANREKLARQDSPNPMPPRNAPRHRRKRCLGSP